MPSELIKEVLGKDEQIHTLAQELYQQRSLLVMGRGFNYATCLEGALVGTSHYVSRQHSLNDAVVVILMLHV